MVVIDPFTGYSSRKMLPRIERKWLFQDVFAIV